jgi:glyoxylase-like metal-dependent hydrolase (beta-lactamase superfamily II)
MKKVFGIAGTIILVIVAACVFLLWKSFHNFMAVETVVFDPQCIIMIGGGGNSVVLASKDGSKAIVIDTKMGSDEKKLSKVVTAPNITVINTHFDGDHTGGNSLYPKAFVISGSYTREQWENKNKNLKFPDETVQVGSEKILTLDSEIVHIRNMGPAHTWDDCVVYLEKRKLLVTGDLVFITRHPVMSAGKGSDVESWMGVLDSLKKMSDVKTLVPGHGKVSDLGAVSEMKEYFISIKNALDKPEILAALKKKYSGYFALPGMAGFDKTAAFIKQEKIRGQK